MQIASTELETDVITSFSFCFDLQFYFNLRDKVLIVRQTSTSMVFEHSSNDIEQISNDARMELELCWSEGRMALQCKDRTNLQRKGQMVANGWVLGWSGVAGLVR